MGAFKLNKKSHSTRLNDFFYKEMFEKRVYGSGIGLVLGK